MADVQPSTESLRTLTRVRNKDREDTVTDILYHKLDASTLNVTGWSPRDRVGFHGRRPYVPIHLSTYQSIHPSFHLHVCLSIRPSTHHPPTHPPIHPSIQKRKQYLLSTYTRRIGGYGVLAPELLTVREKNQESAWEGAYCVSGSVRTCRERRPSLKGGGMATAAWRCSLKQVSGGTFLGSTKLQGGLTCPQKLCSKQG